MFKKYEYSKNIDFNNIFNSNCAIFSFEFNKYSDEIVKNFLNSLINNFGYKYLSIVYNIDYNGYEEFYDKNIDLTTYTGFSSENIFVKEGFFVTNISHKNDIYKTNQRNVYIHKVNKVFGKDKIIKLFLARLNQKFSNIIFLHITETLAIYGNDEMGFGLIDISNNNNNNNNNNNKLFTDVKNFISDYNIISYKNY